MYYALNDNVYLVEGASRSCIYNFNSNKLYNLNNALSTQIKLLNQGRLCVGTIDSDLECTFRKLIDEKIIFVSEYPKTHDISEIKEDNQMSCEFAWIEITTHCNLRCIHCYNDSDIHCDLSMSVENYKTVIDKLIELGVEKVQLIGGEPFCHNHLKEMLNYTLGKFPFVEIFTNGTLITSDWYDYFSKNEIAIALSVYSYNEEMHDKVTNKEGSFEKTNNTIKELKKHGIRYRVCNVLMRNIDLGDKNTDLYTLSDDKDIVRMSGRASFSLLSDELIYRKLITKNTFQRPLCKETCIKMVSGHNCFNNRIYISASGEIFPCVMERRMKHGIIDKTKKIILDEKIRLFNKDKIESCSQCEYRYACFDCRPNSLTGNLKEKPWYCTYNPYTGEWIDEKQYISQLREWEIMYNNM